MDAILATAVWLVTALGAWSSGTVASRYHDNRHHHHRHHHQVSSSTSAGILVHCRHDDDCRQPNSALKGDETCHWLYEGCSVGICMCDPMTQKKHPHTGKCIPSLYGRDRCNVTQPAACPSGMMCSSLSGLCECRVGRMTRDRLFCLRYHQKLVGSSCTPRVDTCYQRAVYGYTSSEVKCHSSRHRCECTDERQQGITCSTWKLHESGCTKPYHCEGGAICIDGRCVCPTGYTGTSSDDHTKCVKRDAIRDLPLGAECDEINELKYCAQGLVCQRCASHDPVFRCLRFRLTAMIEQPRYYGGGGATLRPSCVSGWLVSQTAVSCLAAFLSLTCTSLQLVTDRYISL